MRKKLRKMQIHSHNYFARGYFVGYTKKDDVMYAVVETKSAILTYELKGPYSIEFKDWEG